METFGGTGNAREQKLAATVERVASKLAVAESFAGVDGEVEHAILGDLLLSFCLENRNRSLGRQEQVIRVAPPHSISPVDRPATGCFTFALCA